MKVIRWRVAQPPNINAVVIETLCSRLAYFAHAFYTTGPLKKYKLILNWLSNTLRCTELYSGRSSVQMDDSHQNYFIEVIEEAFIIQQRSSQL